MNFAPPQTLHCYIENRVAFSKYVLFKNELSNIAYDSLVAQPPVIHMI